MKREYDSPTWQSNVQSKLETLQLYDFLCKTNIMTSAQGIKIGNRDTNDASDEL